jgi:hypothetical protein
MLSLSKKRVFSRDHPRSSLRASRRVRLQARLPSESPLPKMCDFNAVMYLRRLVVDFTACPMESLDLRIKAKTVESRGLKSALVWIHNRLHRDSCTFNRGARTDTATGHLINGFKGVAIFKQ